MKKTKARKLLSRGPNSLEFNKLCQFESCVAISCPERRFEPSSPWQLTFHWARPLSLTLGPIKTKELSLVKALTYYSDSTRMCRQWFMSKEHACYHPPFLPTRTSSDYSGGLTISNAKRVGIYPQPIRAFTRIRDPEYTRRGPPSYK